MREKDRGIWQTYTLARLPRPRARLRAGAGRARASSAATSCRCSATTAPASTGRSSPRRRWAACRCRSTRTSIASELAYVLDHAEVSVVVAEDQEQVDKVLSLAGELPNLRLVVYEDPRGMSGYARRHAQVVRRARGSGRAPSRKEHPDYFERELDQGRADDMPLIAYTSGTTGRSKGVLLSHANMIATAESFASRRAGAARRQLAVLPADGLGRRHDRSRSAPAWWSAPPATAPRAPRRCSATCASWGPARSSRRRASGRTC